jgi:hypothetical protein
MAATNSPTHCVHDHAAVSERRKATASEIMRAEARRAVVVLDVTHAWQDTQDRTDKDAAEKLVVMLRRRFTAVSDGRSIVSHLCPQTTIC